MIDRHLLCEFLFHLFTQHSAWFIDIHCLVKLTELQLLAHEQHFITVDEEKRREIKSTQVWGALVTKSSLCECHCGCSPTQTSLSLSLTGPRVWMLLRHNLLQSNEEHRLLFVYTTLILTETQKSLFTSFCWCEERKKQKTTHLTRTSCVCLFHVKVFISQLNQLNLQSVDFAHIDSRIKCR